MNKTFCSSVLIVASAFLFAPEDSQAVKKVSRMMNSVEFFGGSASPHGEYNGMVDVDFVDQNDMLVDIDAKDFLDNSLFLGVNYGALLGGRSLLQLGFRFTNHNIDKSVIDVGVDYHYFNLDLDWSYKFYFMDLNKSSFSPFIGGSAQTGFTTVNYEGYDTERNFDIVLSANFGADLKVWSSPNGRAYLTLSSTNDYNFTSTNNRPKYLDVGLGLKYFFQP